MTDDPCKPPIGGLTEYLGLSKQETSKTYGFSFGFPLEPPKTKAPSNKTPSPGLGPRKAQVVVGAEVHPPAQRQLSQQAPVPALGDDAGQGPLPEGKTKPDYIRALDRPNLWPLEWSSQKV